MATYAIKPLPQCRQLTDLVDKYKKVVEDNPRYGEEDEVLRWLFETYPENTDFKQVMAKIMALDSSYSTHLRNSSSIYKLAKWIVNPQKNFDDEIKSCKLSLIDEMCNIDEEVGKPFSFATKYCCHSYSAIIEDKNYDNKFAIYDSFVANVLTYYREKGMFLDEENENEKGLIDEWKKSKRGVTNMQEALKHSYETVFYPIIDRFRKNYMPTMSLRDLDYLLWQMGKEFFLGYRMAKASNLIIICSEEKSQISIYELRHEYIVMGEEGSRISIYGNTCNESHDSKKEKDKPKFSKVVDYDFSPNPKDSQLALRLLQEYYPCVMRKEGKVGKKLYIEVKGNDNVMIYEKIYDTAIEARNKKKTPLDIQNKIKSDVYKAFSNSKIYKDLCEEETYKGKNLEAFCKEIVEQYYMKLFEGQKGSIEPSGESKTKANTSKQNENSNKNN